MKYTITPDVGADDFYDFVTYCIFQKNFTIFQVRDIACYPHKFKKEEYEIRKNFKASIHGDWRSAMKKKDKSLIYFGMCKSFKKTIKHLKISKEV